MLPKVYQELPIESLNEESLDVSLCLDPKKATIFAFNDVLDASDISILYEVEFCQTHYANETVCKSKEELVKFFEQNIVILHWFALRAKLDLYRESDYISHSSEMIGED